MGLSVTRFIGYSVLGNVLKHCGFFCWRVLCLRGLRSVFWGIIPFSFLFWPPGGGFSSPSVPKPGRGSCAAAWGMWGQNDGENQKDFSLFLLNSLLSLCLPGPLSSKAHPGSVTSGVPSPPVPVTALGLCLASHGNLEFIFEGMRESLPSLCRQCHTRGALCAPSSVPKGAAGPTRGSPGAVSPLPNPTPPFPSLQGPGGPGGVCHILTRGSQGLEVNV